MKCCSRSTTWPGRVLPGAVVGLLLALPAVATGGQVPGSEESAVRHAVVQAVKARMGQDADVRIDDLEFKTTLAADGATLAANPEPGARLGRQSRFSLQWLPASGVRRPAAAGGYAIANVSVTADHVRATREIGRGETCAEGDLVTSRGEVGPVPLQRLPGLADVAGARVLRPLGQDEVVTAVTVQVRPAVQSGDVVAVRAAIDGVTVQGQAVAQQTGSEGDVIRVVNRESRRPLKARVIGPGKVEVVQ
jgi:flagella basal body P-ring formation protein FlgA